ncbi:MAG TPA: GYF domain-containing protein [Verrucomicrobiae bacterium]|nr:GYF domain-containing protein [Verrucomicrobiae bacterium]
MYKIIGADQKEYGPVSAELIRQWIVEGRANAQTQARLEGETEWKPLSSFQDFEAALRSVPPPGAPFAGTAAGPVPVEVILGREYELDIGSCIARAWDLVRQNFWPVVGVSLLIMIITAAINQVVSLASGPAFRTIILEHRVSPGIISVIVATSLLSSPIYTLLTAGLFKYYLKLIRAEGPTLGDAFAGFSPLAGQLVLLGLVNGLLASLGYILCIIPGIYLTVSWVFSLPLVIDRKLPFWDAMELSRKVVSRHWFITFAFVLVIGLLAGCGALLCCVGLFVTMPIASMALLYAYEDIFGRAGA